MDGKLVRISKFVSLALRHDPAAAGVELDPAGWTDLERLIEGARAKGVALDREALAAIMAQSDKARFEVSDDGARIRAVHGHSVDVEAHGPAETPPDTLWHGTADRFLDAILAEGLKPMSRRFVHLSENRENAQEVGKRHGRLVLLTVAAGALAAEGEQFFRSSSGVWLTRRVPPGRLTVEG